MDINENRLAHGSGKGKGKTVQITTNKNKKKKEKESLSARAGITFNPARIQRYLRKGPYAPRISPTASVYLAAVVEYLVAEICDISYDLTASHKKKIITPQFINLAVRGDTELDKLWSEVTIPQGGVVPHIHQSLLPPPKKSKGKNSTKGKKET